MAATMIELAVITAGASADSRAGLERLVGVGPVFVLAHADTSESKVLDVIGTDLDVGLVRWTGVDVDRSLGGTAYSGGGRRLDPAAIARLKALQALHGANWLIAAEETLASARACPGLHVVCVGPALDESDPTRPDHRAHSLLDAARFIETSVTFG